MRQRRGGEGTEPFGDHDHRTVGVRVVWVDPDESVLNDAVQGEHGFGGLEAELSGEVDRRPVARRGPRQPVQQKARRWSDDWRSEDQRVIRVCRPEPGDRFDLDRPHCGGDPIEQMAVSRRRYHRTRGHMPRTSPRPFATSTAAFGDRRRHCCIERSSRSRWGRTSRIRGESASGRAESTPKWGEHGVPQPDPWTRALHATVPTTVPPTSPAASLVDRPPTGQRRASRPATQRPRAATMIGTRTGGGSGPMPLPRPTRPVIAGQRTELDADLLRQKRHRLDRHLRPIQREPGRDSKNFNNTANPSRVAPVLFPARAKSPRSSDHTSSPSSTPSAITPPPQRTVDRPTPPPSRPTWPQNTRNFMRGHLTQRTRFRTDSWGLGLDILHNQHYLDFGDGSSGGAATVDRRVARVSGRVGGGLVDGEGVGVAVDESELDVGAPA